MRDGNISYFTLPTGHKLVCMQARQPVGCFGFTALAGSRYESDRTLYGIAHFVEHTIFKGTTHRRPWHINNRMEAVGGELNAFTTKEEITVYTIFPRGHLARAAELIADLAANPTFPEKELAKEKEVVREEINSYLDSPSELVFDEFENHIFAGSQLGHQILGTEENLKNFTREACSIYVQAHFTPPRMQLFYSGPESPARVYSTVARQFDKNAASGHPVSQSAIPPAKPAANPPFSKTREVSSHQAHTVIGAQTPGEHSELRYPLALLTNIIGGPGMNSRMNTELREHRGLVYSADASLSLLPDCGLFTAYFGCNNDDYEMCADITMRIIHELSTNPPAGRKLAAAKKQYLGQLAVAAASIEQTTLSMAHAALINGEVAGTAALHHHIEKITPDDIAESACIICNPSRLTLL